MTKKIRDRVVSMLIKRALKKKLRSNKGVSLQSAKRIGLLALLDSETKFNQVAAFKKLLEEEGKQVLALGFIPQKNTPDFLLLQAKIDVFSKRNVNFWGVPKGAFVRNFTHEKFDILIDVSVGEFTALKYIAGVSDAGIKVGKYQKNMLYVYDFMIKYVDKMPYDEYLSSIKNYLSLINTSGK